MASRNQLKQFADYLGLLLVSPLLLYWAIARRANGGKSASAFQGVSHLLSLLPGIFGVICRRSFYRRSLANCSPNTFVGFGALLTNPGLELGEHVYIGPKCTIGLATIGADTLIGSNVDIPSGKHQHRFSSSEIPIRLQGGESTRVMIGQDVWIGNGSIVLADVGDHAIIAAGSVVVDPVKSWAIAAGNPARVIRERDH